MNELSSIEETAHPETRIARLKFDQIDPNPYRDLINNPLTQERVERLADSIRSTGFWDNVVVRPHPTHRGRYQLAYGHARMEAARDAGMVEAWFTVREFDDAAMIRVMADENISQFGKDSFKTYKEATVAAATHLMLEVLDGGSANSGRTSGQGVRNDFSDVIASGGCPGRDRIKEFYNGTLNSHDIELALDAFRSTGELAAWHEKNNHKLQRKEPAPKPTLDAEALQRFDKPDHVRTFTEALRETKTPVALQAQIADAIIEKLGAEPTKSAKGRDTYQGAKSPDTRFNSGNIRKEVIDQAVRRAQSGKQKAELDRLNKMSTLEKALLECSTGLTRTLHGYLAIAKALEVMGGVTVTDMTPTALQYLEQISQALAELQQHMKQPAFKGLLRITSAKDKQHD